VLLVRRSSGVALVVGALLAWADADTPTLAVTRFAVVLVAVATIGVALSYLVRDVDEAVGSAPTDAGDPPVGRQLSFAGFDGD
jgi:hypothetical protein